MTLAERIRPAITRPRTLAWRIALMLATALLLSGLFGRIMGYDLRRDEFMFLPPAALLGEFRLYEQIFYNHVPYSAWLFRAVHLLLPDLGLVAMGRLTIFAAWIMLLGVAAWLGWRLTRSAAVAGFGAVSLLSADVLLGQTGMAATNNLLPMPFALLGLGLIAVALSDRDLSAPRLFAAGVMLSVAVGLKVSAVAVLPAVIVACLIVPRDLGLAARLRRLVLPVALGGIVGALPLIWLALRMPDVFFAHIMGYHLGPHVAFWQANAASEPGLALDLRGKLQLAQGIWLSGASLLAVFVPVLALVLRPGRVAGVVWMVAGAIAGAAVIGFLPSPGFPQYYAMPLAGLPLLTALLYARLDPARRAVMAPVLAAAAIVMIGLAAPRLGMGLIGLGQPDRLTPARVAQGARALSDAMSQAGLAHAGPIATLSPIYPLQAGFAIYPEFAAGPFAYRVADVTPPDLRALYAMAGPRDLDALFDATPPAAILTGFDPELEAGLTGFARSHGYLPQDLVGLSDRYGSGTLWLRPPTTLTGENP